MRRVVLMAVAVIGSAVTWSVGTSVAASGGGPNGTSGGPQIPCYEIVTKEAGTECWEWDTCDVGEPIEIKVGSITVKTNTGDKSRPVNRRRTGEGNCCLTRYVWPEHDEWPAPEGPWEVIVVGPFDGYLLIRECSGGLTFIFTIVKSRCEYKTSLTFGKFYRLIPERHCPQPSGG
ncbi:MAG: hypothetical protein AB1486_31785 [Planctomycetota bacterium]